MRAQERDRDRSGHRSPEAAQAAPVPPAPAPAVADVLAMQRSAGNAAVSRMLARQPEEASPADAPLIVEDAAEPPAGGMRRSEFVAQVRSVVPGPAAAMLEPYANADARTLEQLLRQHLPEAAGAATAQEYLDAIAARAGGGSLIGGVAGMLGLKRREEPELQASLAQHEDAHGAAALETAPGSSSPRRVLRRWASGRRLARQQPAAASLIGCDPGQQQTPAPPTTAAPTTTPAAPPATAPPATTPATPKPAAPLPGLTDPKDYGKSSGDASAITDEKLKDMSEKKKKKWETFRDTRDAKARSFGAADYEDYVQNMLVSGGKIVGLKASATRPLHPLFLQRLEQGSINAQKAMGDTDFGIRTISGQENRPGNHAWGIASDFDSDSNPYVINEAGEEEHDKLLEVIYQRIAQALLKRDTVLTRSVEPAKKGDKGTPSKLVGAKYDLIAEEADAMAAYFSVLDDPTSKDHEKRAKLKARRKLSSATFKPEDLAALDKKQVQADYDFLLTKKGSSVGGDAVFVGGGAGSYRDPMRGFMSIRKEIAEAMTGVGLRWGGNAASFGGECGDIMHFDDGDRHADYVAYGAKNPTAKRKAEGG